MQKPLLTLIVALLAMQGANAAAAADQAQAMPETQATTQSDELIYGSQLMTPQERAEHRAKMHSLKTKEEREAFRVEHHKMMQERAKKMGKKIPDMPPMQRCGAGYGGPECRGAGRPEPESGGAGY